MLDVDFEFFSPAEQDFHGLKSLLRQLFDVDSETLDLSGLSDLIISQPDLGSTVKCDGEESDPFAFLTILDLKTQASNPAVAGLRSYLSARCAASLPQTADLLASPDADVALVLGERLLNMPSEVVPALYTLLSSEMPSDRKFTHFLIVSKTYAEVTSALTGADEVDRPKKKSRAGAGGKDEVFYFHAEDEVLGRTAVETGGWEYVKAEEGSSDARRAFQDAGIKPKGHAILLAQEGWTEAVKAVETYLGQS